MYFMLKAAFWLLVIYMLLPASDPKPVQEAARAVIHSAQDASAKAATLAAVAEAAAELEPARAVISHTLNAQDLEFPFAGKAKQANTSPVAAPSATSLAPLFAPLPKPRKSS